MEPDSASYASAEGTTTKWSFQTMLLANGQSALETSSSNDLLASIAADSELTSRSRHRSSYRIVKRQEVEDCVRAMQLEAAKAERDQQLAIAAAEALSIAAANEEQSGHTPPPADATVFTSQHQPLEQEIEIGEVVLTPTTMAHAFQRLVALEKQAFIETISTIVPEESAPSMGASGTLPTNGTRIFLLAGYPSTLAEASALLLTGEIGQTKTHAAASSGSGIPLFPLLDGVLLVVDPMRELRERRKSVSKSDERRNSIPRRVSADVKPFDIALPPTTSSKFQTATPFLRELYDTASVGGLEWSDFVFLDIPCTISVNEVTPPVEMAHDLVKTMDPIITDKNAFKEWAATVKTIALPAFDSECGDAKQTETHYENILLPVFGPSVSVAMVVFAMREAVVRAMETTSESTVETVNDNNPSVPEPFLIHGDEAALRVALSYDLFTKQQHGGLSSEEEDQQPCEVLNQRIDHLEKTLWRTSDLPGVGNQGRKAMPVKPRLNDAERSVLDTEFASFATTPVARVHFTRQLLRLEELLGQSWKGNLRERELTESLSRDILPQRLASVLRENGSLLKEYDEPTDALLVAAITTTAPGRFRTTAWTAREYMRHRPALKDWQRELPLSDEYLTPRTALAATACVPLSAGQLGAVAEKCSIVYPADQSIVKLIQTPHAPAWLSVSLRGDVFGLRPRPPLPPSTDHAAAQENKLFAMQCYANWHDGSQLLVQEGQARPKKPDGHASITVTQTFVDGLMVTACSDGTIVQRRLHGAAVATNEEEKEDRVQAFEKYRVISGKGAVVVVMLDESRRILLPSGNVVLRGAGAGSEADGAIDDGDASDSDARKLIVDPETNALVEVRVATGVVVVTHTDGARVTYHTDGTCMYATATRSHVLITKQGLADVCMDVEVNLTAHRHANGEKVAVTKGGLRTRSIVRVADGTEIQVQYNSKVVAEVNGRIVTEKPDGTRVVAKDSGRVEVTPRPTTAAATTTTTTTTGETNDDADRDELSHNSVYYFNCREGSLSLCDHEQNQFRVEVGDGRGLPSVHVDLAGMLSESDADKYQVEPIPAKAVINEPIEPFLFILNGDGTGREVLRPRDAREFLSTAAGAHKATNYYEATPPALRPPLLSSSPSSEWWEKNSRWSVERTFLHNVRPDPHEAEVRQRTWFHDDQVARAFDHLKIPVATAFAFLVDGQMCPPLSVPGNQCTIIRRIEQLRPMDSHDVSEMLATLAKWKEWRSVREANKDRFKVEDPRSADMVAQELAMQRKVIAAVKATRARKRAERQKLREQQKKTHVESNTGTAAAVAVAHMETVQEGNEPQDGAQGDDDNDELDQLLSDGSDDDSHSDVDMEVDDPDELMWTAFSDVETDGSGRLTVAQARQALVHVLGYGVTTGELITQLYAYRQQEPFAISFEVFADLVDAFRMNDNDDSPSLSRGDNQVIDAATLLAEQHGGISLKQPLAAGSAAEAVRSFNLRLASNNFN